MKEGARKAPSFALWITVSAIVVVAGGAGYLLPQLIRPADPISPAIERGYAQCHASTCRTGSLIPDVFARGEVKAAVELRLSSAGYQPRAGYFAKPAPKQQVPGCTLSYYVVPRYDTAGGLTMAFGEVADSCN